MTARSSSFIVRTHARTHDDDATMMKHMRIWTKFIGIVSNMRCMTLSLDCSESVMYSASLLLLIHCICSVWDASSYEYHPPVINVRSYWMNIIIDSFASVAVGEVESFFVRRMMKDEESNLSCEHLYASS